MRRGEGGVEPSVAGREWKYRIEHNWDFLVGHLGSLGALSDHLIARHVFSSHDADFVECGDRDGTDKARNRRFLQRLLKKGPDAYRPFMEALRKTCNNHIGVHLESTDMSSLSVSDPSSSPVLADTETDGEQGPAPSMPRSDNNPSTINIGHAKVFIGYQNPADMFNSVPVVSGTRRVLGTASLLGLEPNSYPGAPASLLVPLRHRQHFPCRVSPPATLFG
ncbi:hypothetical protein ACOMHN_005634 [Nucella lapillus]